MIANHLTRRILQCFSPTDVNPDAGIKLEGLAPGSRLRAPKHHAHFFPKLIGKDTGGLGLAHDSRKFTQGLTHQTRLHTHGSHPHVALQLGFGHECGD